MAFDCFLFRAGFHPIAVFHLFVAFFFPLFTFNVSLPVPALGGDDPFAYSANWGGTGIMETPTARVLKKGRYRAGISQIDPYRYFYGAVSPLKGLEIGGRITEIRGVAALTADYGNYKDKAVDLKYQFIPEGKYLPAVALGIMDPHGTRKYPSQYIAASKQIFPFDFTIGFGNGRFGRKPLASQGEGFKAEIFSNPKEWLSDSLFFGSIQFAPSEKFSLMVEYSPIRYQEQTSDPARDKYFQEPVSSKFNFGIRWKPFDWTELDFSYQRGNQFGLNISVAFDLGSPLVPIYDHPYKEKPANRTDPSARRIARALNASGFSSVGVRETGDELWVEAENDKYYYPARAIGVMLRAIVDVVPAHTQVIHVTLSENGIPVVQFTTTKEKIAELREERLTASQFYYLSQVRTDIDQTPTTKKEYETFFDYGLSPDFKMFLNDPSGFFKYRLGLIAWTSYKVWSGASIIGGIAGYPLNTVSSSVEPLSMPVRSDLVPYLENKVVLQRVMFEQIAKMKHELYGRMSGGFLETEYGGIDGEVAMPIFNGRILVGLSGSLVRKRDPDNPVRFKQDDWKDYYTAGFVNGRLNLPEQEMALDIKAGQFLAGDRGVRFTISKFFNGVVLSAWYSVTDTSIFKDSFNNGYHDKGIAVTIPLRLFSGTDKRKVYNYSISPWTRDVAQDIEHFTNLFDYIGRTTEVFLEKDRSRLTGGNQ